MAVTMVLQILQKLFTSSAAPAAVPTGTRVYAVGDIHGRADLLQTLVDRIKADAEENPIERRVLVYIGDYVDRGLQSRDVIEYLCSDPTPDFEVVCLKGNHDAWLLDFLDDPGIGPSWLNIGGQATLLSYGVGLSAELEPGKRLQAASEALRSALPSHHLHFLRELALSHTEGDYLFVHAGIRPGIALDAQREQDLLWIRDEFTADDSQHGKCVVHGHSVSTAPEHRRNRIGIDTGAYATGRLTCLRLEGEAQGFLTT